MQDHIVNRVKDTLAAKKATAAKKQNERVPFGTDKRVKAAVHQALRAAHKHTFESEAAKDKSFEAAKGRHAAIVSLASPEEEDGKHDAP